MWIQISQLLRKLVDQDPTVYYAPYVMATVYYAAYVMAHGLVDMIVTCFHLLKIARDSNFFFAFGENY